jgi:polysaccharide pyruvyl transferase CsaB
MARSPIKIALSGYYGCGNTGDEAVLAGIVESFRRRAGEGTADFTVLSQNPADTERRHGLKAVNRMSRAVLKATLVETDLLISGGGSLLQDTTSLRSLIYYLWVVRIAQAAKTPVMFYAQGIGPLRRSLARTLTRLVANRVQQITVRDEGSANLLKQIGVRKPPIEVTADPAFALTPADPERVDALLRETGVPTDQPVIGIALRPWHIEKPSIADYAEMCWRLAEDTRAHLLFLPMQPPGDLDLSEQLAAGMTGRASVLKLPISPQEMVGITTRLQGLAAMRLHALIFGAVTGTPMVALSYDPKVTQLMEILGQGARTVALKSFSAEEVSAKMASALAEGYALRASLRNRAESLAEKALVNVDRALAIAGRR